MEMALGEGSPAERMDRAAPLILSLEAADLPAGLAYRFIGLRESLERGDHLASDDACAEMARCLRELEGVVNPYEDTVK